MAQVAIGSLTIFNHEVQEWSLYKDKLEQWFFANNIEADSDKPSKRRAILLSSLSDLTYKLVRDLAQPAQVGELSYTEVVKLLDGHFKTKKCGFAERFKFHSATQLTSENLAAWAARVRGLAIHCGFSASTLNETLRDRFVLGMTPGPEREKLFNKDMSELTLSKALEVAEGVRCARLGSQQATPGAITSAQALDQLQVLKMSTTPRQARAQTSNAASAQSTRVSVHQGCPACGYDNHQLDKCKFTRYKCKKCGVKGHLRRMCPKNESRLHFVECRSDSEDDGKQIIYNIRTFGGEPMKEFVQVGGTKLCFEIDTGSAVTVISEDIFKLHFAHMTLSPSTVLLQSYNGGNITTLGYLPLQFTYNGQSNFLNVYVVRDGGPPLLGRDFLSQFKLQISTVNWCDDVLSSLAIKYPNLFSGKLGCLKNITVELNLKPDSKPVFRKARQLPFSIREKVEKEITRLVDLGILVPVQYSEYASPIVPVLRQDKDLRLCADYSGTINKQLLVDKYPLPRVEELFAKLHGGQQFSKLDLQMAYNQCCLSESSQPITCINTHKGLYKFTRLVFGLSPAPAIFQRIMETLLSGLDGVLLMMDDILVTGNTKEQHLDRLHQVFRRLENAGLVLQKEKCSLFQDSVTYLGFTIDRFGVHKSPEKVSGILNAKKPTNISELKSFLGMINYYRNFIRNASAILSPLHNLLHKNVQWLWGPEHDQAFESIKKELASETTLAHYNPDAQLILTVDASPTGLGSILSQVEQGIQKPISFMSRSLNAAEKRYSQIQKEATAIIFGVRKFHQYLYGRADPFILRTDHKPLLSIFSPEKGIPEISANRLQRYAIFLSAYNYKIEFVNSANNSADYLSRSVSEKSVALNSIDTITVDNAAYINFVFEGERFLTVDQLCEKTRTDEHLSLVSKYLLDGWPNKSILDTILKQFYDCRFELSMENGCLLRGHKVVVPQSLRPAVLRELHCGHLGMSKMKAEARSRFWWPGLSADIERYVASCVPCATVRPSPPRVPLAPWPFPPRPWHRVHIDLLGPINNKIFLIVVDAHSKWVECFDVSSGYGTRVIIEKLCEVMARFGLFNTICSDNGTSFVSSEFKEFCLRNGIQHITSPAYNPQSNGQAEIYVRIVKKAIKTIILSGTLMKDLNIKLQEFLLRYRNSKHNTTEKSPSEVLFGHNLKCRLDLINENRFSLSAATLNETVKRNQSLQCENYAGRREISFSVGEIVLVKVYKNNKSFWTLGSIEEKLGSSCYMVKLKEADRSVKKHANQILKYKGEEYCDQNQTGNECLRGEAQVIPAFILPEPTPQAADDRAIVTTPEPAQSLPEAAHPEFSTPIQEPPQPCEPATSATTTADTADEPDRLILGRPKRKRNVVNYKEL